ncbi:hypothetical protein CDAR_230241 [Caerostris darwini]|uniref:Uncharacterized protein n=1 Tax=Caerostris darwini TaxID=1538125 RepID=A0AAV4MJK8_9ARAC|nr:hypothetical protein CDAR_230241 [Caerostris darwini]
MRAVKIASAVVASFQANVECQERHSYWIFFLPSVRLLLGGVFVTGLEEWRIDRSRNLRYQESHGTFDSSVFLTKTSLNPGIPRPVVILGCHRTGWKVKGNEKSDLRRRRTEGREKNPITMSFLAFSVGLDTSNNSRSNFPRSHSREAKMKLVRLP